MVEAHPHCERGLGLDQHADIVGLKRLHPEGPEFRQVLGDGVVERKQPLLDEDCGGDAAEPLSLRALHEGVVEGHAAPCGDIGPPDARNLRPVPGADDADRARQLAGVDPRLDGRGHARRGRWREGGRERVLRVERRDRGEGGRNLEKG